MSVHIIVFYLIDTRVIVVLLLKNVNRQSSLTCYYYNHGPLGDAGVAGCSCMAL